MPVSFCGANLQGRSFQGEDLTQADFSGSDIRGADFRGAVLRQANFKGARAGLPRHRQRWFAAIAIVWLMGFLAIAGLASAQFAQFVHQADQGVSVALLSLLTLIILVWGAYRGSWAAILRDGLEVAVWGGLVVGIIVLIVAVGTTLGNFQESPQYYLMQGYRQVQTWLALGLNPGSAVTQLWLQTVAIAIGLILGLRLGVALLIAVMNLGTRRTVGSALVWGMGLSLLGLGWQVFRVALIARDPFITEAGVADLRGLMLFSALSIVLFGAHLGWRDLAKNRAETAVRRLAIAFSSLGGTCFEGADLTEADFSEAYLAHSNFRRAILTHVRWHRAELLHRVRSGNSYLRSGVARHILMTQRGERQTCDRQRLCGINLNGINLAGASFIGTDLRQAQLRGADLQGARLIRTNLEGADLSDARLTGAYLQDCRLTAATLKAVECHHIYLRERFRWRRYPAKNASQPSSSLSAAEFEQLIQPMMTSSTKEMP